MECWRRWVLLCWVGPVLIVYPGSEARGWEPLWSARIDAVRHPVQSLGFPACEQSNSCITPVCISVMHMNTAAAPPASLCPAGADAVPASACEGDLKTCTVRVCCVSQDFRWLM